MVEEEYEEEYVEENKTVMGLLEKTMMQLKKEENPKIVYHPAPARRYNAPWKIMSDFEIPLVLICDDYDNHGAPHRAYNPDDEYDRKYYRDLFHIQNIPQDGRVIRNEYCDAFCELKLDYRNRLIYRGLTDASIGIKELPSIDVIYIDYLIGFGLNYDPSGKETAVREIIEYCKHIRDGGLILLEYWIVHDILRTNPDFKYQADGNRSRNRFGKMEIEYLGDYNLNLGDSHRDNIDVFKIHSKLKLEDQSDFLKTCFVDINWD